VAGSCILRLHPARGIVGRNMPDLAVTKWDAATAANRLRRIRWWRAIRIVAVGLLLLSIALDHLRAANRSGDDWFRFDGKQVAFVRSVDGQCIEVRDAGSDQITPVRIMGIVSLDGHWDAAARIRLQTLLRGHALTIHLEPTQTRDDQGRLLASVFMDDGQDVAAELAKEGLARADRRARFAFHGAIEEAQHDARKKHAGLWSAMAEETLAARTTR
jgi:endonuclease YncB( thermonuclease family)